MKDWILRWIASHGPAWELRTRRDAVRALDTLHRAAEEAERALHKVAKVPA